MELNDEVLALKEANRVLVRERDRLLRENHTISGELQALRQAVYRLVGSESEPGILDDIKDNLACEEDIPSVVRLIDAAIAIGMGVVE